MGGIRRIRRKMGQKIALADTKMAANGCQILLGHPDPRRATATAKEFAGWLATTINRSRCVNMSDLYNSYVEIQRKLEMKESLIN